MASNIYIVPRQSGNTSTNSTGIKFEYGVTARDPYFTQVPISQGAYDYTTKLKPEIGTTQRV